MYHVYHVYIMYIYIYVYWEFHHPNWRTHIFQRDRSTTNQMMKHVRKHDETWEEKWWTTMTTDEVMVKLWLMDKISVLWMIRTRTNHDETWWKNDEKCLFVSSFQCSRPSVNNDEKSHTTFNFYVTILIPGWWFQRWIFISISYMGCHPSQLTNSIIFQDGYCTTNHPYIYIICYNPII